MKTRKFKAIDFQAAHEAIQWTEANGKGRAVLLHGLILVLEQAEIDRLAASGVELAYLCDHEMSDGTHRIVTVPVND
jgi:hypothetical protein